LTLAGFLFVKQGKNNYNLFKIPDLLMIKKRSAIQKIIDFILFPLRSVTLFQDDKWGLSSLASERYYYVAKHVKGFCLDVGCGRFNRFVAEFLNGNGKGIDVFAYEGLTKEQIVEDMSRFPFENNQFESMTFIANINHIPKHLRPAELAEAFRCLKSKGNIIVTMGNPLAEIVVHKIVWFYDKFFGTNVDVDGERGMEEDEEYYLLDAEIIRLLKQAGFTNIKKEYFITQWFLNHLITAQKP
jgi:SAM-dependent methyltransferase